MKKSLGLLAGGFSLFLALFLGSWGSEDGAGGQAIQNEITASIFSDSVTEFRVQVFYETGAEPRAGAMSGVSSGDVWDITESSYQALFSEHEERSIFVPKELNQMTEIADQGQSEWSTEELVELGSSLTGEAVENNVAQIAVIFLEGTLGGNDSVLGVHITGTPFCFVFKDVAESVGGTGSQQDYVEQATVVHEIGHTIGLVNNGIPMVQNHEDQEHQKHTTNQDGVMYWAVESSDTILDALLGAINGSDLNLFGEESLSDARAYHP